MTSSPWWCVIHTMRWDEIVVNWSLSCCFPSQSSPFTMNDASMLCSLKFACVRGPARHAGAHQRIVQHSARLIPWPWPWSWPLINSRAEEIERIILFLSSPITAVCGREREANANADLPTVRGCVVSKTRHPLLPDGRSDDCTAHAGTEQTPRDGWRRARGPFLAPRRVATSPSPRRAVFRAATRSLRHAVVFPTCQWIVQCSQARVLRGPS